MDLLFKRYASPFLLLDGIISSCRLLDFLNTFQKQKMEDEMWELYLHKSPFDERSWEEFKNGFSYEEDPEIPSDEQLETTVKSSYEMLQNFEIERG